VLVMPAWLLQQQLRALAAAGSHTSLKLPQQRATVIGLQLSFGTLCDVLYVQRLLVVLHAAAHCATQ
jgi:hypothetical protein